MNIIKNKTGSFYNYHDKHEFKGILELKNNNICLKTNLSSFFKDKYKKIEVIIGNINGVDVTLYNCQLLNSYENLYFIVEYIFKGYNFKDTLFFQGCFVKFDYLNEWMTNHSFLIKRNVDLFQITPYPHKKSINLGYFNIDFGFGKYISESRTSFEVKNNFEIKFEYNEPTLFNDILKDVNIFKNFLTFAIYTKIDIFNFNIYIKDSNGNNIEFQVFSRNFNLIEKSDFQIFNVLMEFHKIEDNLEFLLNNWYAMFYKFKPFFDIYFINFSNNLYAEALLIAYTQALESYMRDNDSFEDKYIVEEDYDEISKEIKNFISNLELSKDHKQSLNSRIKYGNEYSLRSRLKSLFKEFKNFELIKLILNEYSDKFVDIVVETRNYYTHFDKKHSLVKSGKELVMLNNNLRLLLDLCLLKEMRLNQEYINELSSNKWKSKLEPL